MKTKKKLHKKINKEFEKFKKSQNLLSMLFIQDCNITGPSNKT